MGWPARLRPHHRGHQSDPGTAPLLGPPPRPFYVPVLSQRPSPFSPEELLPFGNRRRPLLAGVLCPQPALQGIAGLRVSVGPRWVLDRRGLAVTQATVRSAGGRAGRRATWAMRMPGTCVCVGPGRREGCRGASAVPKGRQQVSATEDCLLFTSRFLVWCLPAAPSLFPSCFVVTHPCWSGGAGPPVFLCFFVLRREPSTFQLKGTVEAMSFHLPGTCS